MAFEQAGMQSFCVVDELVEGHVNRIVPAGRRG